ncbi:Crp/Fnr family transcriptional regulator [Oceanispirochaeta crateris]|uniref:Crp/Fnr family transcriptional regulator n=1 Tax=Oceanispirochaeta crateris TaxID=2518645 RepID=A0A5C1QMF7_9SPIO|nr:Crp/Fnr family transcriptional regulator [Oceanispirochaeta crateris]QEN07734.1 Crp/Fnr family transcriptional regulator [Oceanispirochaeta crateris]
MNVDQGETGLCRTCHNNLCAKKVSIFSSLLDKDIQKIVSLTGHKSYSKGEYLCHEGDISSRLYIVNDGKVKLSKFNKDGKEQILRILSNGSFFGEFYLFSEDEPYNFSAIAISEVKICTLSKSDMDGLLREHPDINRKIMTEISRRLIQTENLVQNLSTNDTNSKVAYVLLELSEKYGITKNNQIHVNIPINREEMASYAGVTRETMSRKLSQFEHLGILQTKGNKTIIILEMDELMNFL